METIGVVPTQVQAIAPTQTTEEAPKSSSWYGAAILIILIVFIIIIAIIIYSKNKTNVVSPLNLPKQKMSLYQPGTNVDGKFIGFNKVLNNQYGPDNYNPIPLYYPIMSLVSDGRENYNSMMSWSIGPNPPLIAKNGVAYNYIYFPFLNKYVTASGGNRYSNQPSYLLNIIENDAGNPDDSPCNFFQLIPHKLLNNVIGYQLQLKHNSSCVDAGPNSQYTYSIILATDRVTLYLSATRYDIFIFSNIV